MRDSEIAEISVLLNGMSGRRVSYILRLARRIAAVDGIKVIECMETVLQGRRAFYQLPHQLRTKVSRYADHLAQIHMRK